MPVHVYRCGPCGREVLVRAAGPLSDAEITRRIDEELRPLPEGRAGRLPTLMRLRDDIWLALSDRREPIPRDRLPRRCPACGRDATLIASRDLDS